VSTPSKSVAAILLSGGASSRMGRDKTQIVIAGEMLAVRTARILLDVVETAFEVGPGTSGLPATLEDPPRQGPLVAIAAGVEMLRERGHHGSALVIACDLPQLSAPLLQLLVEWDAPGSVVPVVRGRPQPLCAKWGRLDLDQTSKLVELGERSLRHLTAQPDVRLLEENDWRHVADEDVFFDVDVPADLERFGLSS
jgi:molybdopterin-guanine dinucleotide biosynthesis protein A